jgi:2,4-dienoyl-CoA reductase-like NADH-dependent reductase (Old Yellow Enzyme family)
MNSNTQLFSPCPLGGVKTSNRFVSQAMEANDAEPGGQVSERAIERYKNLAQGGWGIMIAEAISVTEKSLARKNGLVLNSKNLDGYKRLVEEVKKINPKVIFLFQLTHSGRNSNPAFSEKVRVCPEANDGSRMLQTEEIQSISDLFVEAALMAARAGADGVDMKMCHGYLGAEMLRPSNTRTDRWGGSFENRTRFFRENSAKIRDRIPAGSLILGSRISMYEGIRGGCGTGGADELIEDLSDQLLLIQLMAKLGMDYVNISAGIPGITSEMTRPVKGSQNLMLNHLRYTRIVKDLLNKLGSGTKTIGSAYSILKEDGLLLADENIRKGYTDFVGWGRQSFADPLLPAKIRNGQSIDWCTACSGCSKLMQLQEHDGCIMYNPYYKELNKQVMKKQPL